jgi:V/A-type H+/Na+-transporting ATPase subunit B
MNAAIKLYAEAANAKTKLENGFDLTDFDERVAELCKTILKRPFGH